MSKIFTTKHSKILIIDDDPIIIKFISAALKKQPYKITSSQYPSKAIDTFKKLRPDIVLLDINMPELSGETLLDTFQNFAPEIPIIVLTADEDEELAQRCLDLGAKDFINKPFTPLRLKASISKALELSFHEQQIQNLQSQFLNEKPTSKAFDAILTQSEKMKKLFQLGEIAATSQRDILITGETGTGKDLLAKALHSLSSRPGEYVAVNVAGLDDNHFSDTLFGHLKGSFTGALKERKGLVEKARGGTLFLDEIGDLSIISQVKLLRLLQEREYLPIGSDKHINIDIRFICATSRPLLDMMEDGSFRKDLYYRLRAQQLHLPPLRERKGDIQFLWEYFTNKASKELNKKAPKFSDEAVNELDKYQFGGNIRELEALAFQVIGSYHYYVELKDIKAVLRGEIKTHQTQEKITELNEDGFPEKLPNVDEMIDSLIIAALKRSNGNQTQAAKLIGMSRRGLISRIQRHHLIE